MQVIAHSIFPCSLLACLVCTYNTRIYSDDKQSDDQCLFVGRIQNIPGPLQGSATVLQLHWLPCMVDSMHDSSELILLDGGVFSQCTPIFFFRWGMVYELNSTVASAEGKKEFGPVLVSLGDVI